MSIGEQHRPLRLVVCDEIRRRILEQTYPSGMRLVEEHLAQELGVSRNPVREALRILETEGFVRILPRRGAIVSDNPADIAQLNEVRVALEQLAARLAARKAGAAAGEHLLGILEAAEEAVDHDDYEAVASFGSEFHAAVLGLADNPHLDALLTMLHNRHRGATHIGSGAVVRSIWVFANNQGARGRASVREHRALMEAIVAGDEDAAAAITEDHIRASQSAYEDAALAGLDEHVPLDAATSAGESP